jgi:hypothetical protein
MFMPFEKNPDKDVLKLYAYGTLANFWTSLAANDEMEEGEAQTLLLLQQALLDEYDAILRQHLNEESMRAYRAYVEKFKVRISFASAKPKIHYRR